MARLQTLKLPKGVEIDEISNDNLFTHPSAGSVPTTLAVKDYLHDEIDKHDQAFWPDGMHRNAIINGNFDIWQRGTSFTGKNIYTADRWFLQTHPAYSHTVQRIIEDGHTYLRATVDQVSPYYNIGTIVENGRNLFRGQKLSLRVRLRASGDYTLRAYIVGCSDYHTVSDVILNSAFAVSEGFNDYTFATSQVPDTYNATYPNLRVCIYLQENANVPVGGYIDIAQVQLNIGDKPLPFEQRPIALELALCQRYYEKSYALEHAPGTNTTTNICYSNVRDNTIPPYEVFQDIVFKVEKRTTPTLTWYSRGGTPGIVSNSTEMDIGTADDYEQRYSGTKVARIRVKFGKTVETGNYMVMYHWAADAEL